MHNSNDMPIFETLADFVTRLEETLGHDFLGPEELSSSILDSQDADPDSMERGVRYTCETCDSGMVVYGRSDGWGLEYGPGGGLDIVAERAITEPCTRQKQPGVRVVVRHLLQVSVEEPGEDAPPSWQDPHGEPEQGEPAHEEPDVTILAEGIGIVRVIKGGRDWL